MENIQKSLIDILGKEYIASVIDAQAFLSGESRSELEKIAGERVEFWPDKFQKRQDELLDHVGKKVLSELNTENLGAGTDSFNNAQHSEMSPLAAAGAFRTGEDGRLYLIGKSEHYHASLGHCFPGYKLIENAKRLGITNISHNNTRGYITRLLERELVRIANGLEKDNNASLENILQSMKPHVLNRVINLETGSLAVEAALKMMLARFYRLDKTRERPQYAGKIPVFLVMGDKQGGPEANYHGTTVMTQVLRGMWPDLGEKLDNNGLYSVCPVTINDIEDFKKKVDEFDSGKYKVAGFFHELVLMNYGGIKLTKEFVTEAHAICKEHDIPVIVDEIQSCMWSPELFLFKEYGCSPDFVSVGKGFPGGQYPASKILTTAAMDNLNQFGALVTNGQEELASLSYLITIGFAEANKEHTRKIGKYYHDEIIKLARSYPACITEVEGEAHMTTIFFKTAETAVEFSGYLNKKCCIDISAQTYKANCPPAALTKLPLISSKKVVDFVTGKMHLTLKEISKKKIDKSATSS